VGWDTSIPPSAPVDAKLPAFSPDGTQIAYVHTPDSVDVLGPSVSNQLWTVDVETGARRKVMDGPLLTPDWHPDGSRFVFHTDSQPQYLYVASADGKKLEARTGPGSENPDLGYATVGRWSPDGTQLMFAVTGGAYGGIYVTAAEGGKAKRIIKEGVTPDWFPSGNRIVYKGWDTSQPGPEQAQIFIANVDGSNIRKVTSLSETRNLGWPAVSPDGARIVFYYDKQLWLMDANGANARQITGGDRTAYIPSWHPDGSTILYARRNVGRGISHAYLLDVETLEVRPVFPRE
jgi:Tol biopolymer transport system component